MTIYEIKRQVEKTNKNFFSRDTMRFFNQTLKDFKVYKHYQDGVKGFKISAPSYWHGDLMGYTERFYNPITNELEDLKDAN